jgi:hypothetical protein
MGLTRAIIGPTRAVVGSALPRVRFSWRAAGGRSVRQRLRFG